MGSPKSRRHGSRRASVGVYLVAAFATCLAALGALMAMTSAASFQRERNRTSVELRAAAQDNAYWADQTLPATVKVLESVSTQAAITDFEPASCAAVLSGLSSIRDQGHLHILRPDGSEVCSLTAPDLSGHELEKGEWFAQVQESNQPVDGGTGIDTLSGRPGVTIALPIAGPDGGVGVLAAVLYTGASPLALPPGASPQMVLIELDAERQVVLAVSADAPIRPGPVSGSWLSRPIGQGSQTLVDADGVTRIYEEVTAPDSGWHLLAGLPKTVAMQSAQSELQRNLGLAGAVFLVVTGLGLILHRRLARPVRRLRAAIEAASTDSTARASVEGPAEVAAVAEALNATIAQRRQLEVELAHQALHDPLTHLANRTLLGDRLNLALARACRTEGQVVVAFMDLDRFKLINDSHGHPAGDSLLVALARRLESALRSMDTVARFGGDEFVMISEGVPDEEAVAAIATRLIDCLAAPFTLDGQDIHISGSVGLALGTGQETADEMIRNADAAMYRAKEQGRGGYAIYRERLTAGVLTRLETERDLRRALEADEFVLYYQPKCSVGTAEVVGVEALVRWVHPTRGLVSPVEFIPVSEETGLIVPLGEWVLREACEQSVRWRERNGLHVAVSVNLSARQLAQPGFPGIVARILEETGADPADLCLEITEGTLMVDMAAAVVGLANLRALGVRISIDDFGTGYSSLAYLRTLPIDEIKIDRSFITPVAEDRSSAAIVASIVGLCHALGLLVVAEGVETSVQLDTLHLLDCDVAQGFYLSRPQPAAELTPWLHRLPRPAAAVS